MSQRFHRSRRVVVEPLSSLYDRTALNLHPCPESSSCSPSAVTTSTKSSRNMTNSSERPSHSVPRHPKYPRHSRDGEIARTLWTDSVTAALVSTDGQVKEHLASNAQSFVYVTAPAVLSSMMPSQSSPSSSRISSVLAAKSGAGPVSVAWTSNCTGVEINSSSPAWTK